MTPLTFDEIFSSEAVGAKRELKDAHVKPRLPALERADAKKEAKALALLRRGLKSSESGDDLAMARLALKALDVSPDSSIANQVMGLALERLGRLSQAIAFYERAWRIDPSDANIYYNLGLIAWKLDMLEGAERFYRIAVELHPESEEAIINLAGVLRDQSRHADSIELLRMAIYRAPENHLFWNSIGTSLIEAGDPEQALTFYSEALRLQPEFARGWHNLGYAQGLAGDPAASVEASDRALRNPANPSDRAEMLYSRAISELVMGDLENGWRDYDVRLDPAYLNGPIFLINQPRWDGESSVKGKHVLLVGEQGVGDEVLFVNTVPDLIDEIGDDGSLTIACEPRLAGLFARSFPTVDVVNHGSSTREGRVYRGVPGFQERDDIQLWSPMATPAKRYRRSLDAFPREKAHLVADADRVEEMRAALAALPEGLKIGLCWKSKLMTGKRLKHFSPFENWRAALATPGTVFVSLQYGDVDQEIAHAARDFGAEIHQIPGLDLMNDLEGVAALGAALDLSMGPLNASTNLAAAVGGEVWFIGMMSDWPFLGTDQTPWYPRTRAYKPQRYGDWAGAIGALAGDLKARSLGERTVETAVA